MIITKYVLTPILVPLRGKSCKEDPNSFYCTCSKGRIANGSCDESDGQKFPAKIGCGIRYFYINLLQVKYNSVRILVFSTNIGFG
jgi:hypothetical protein